MKKEICILEDEKTFLEFLLDDFEAKLNNLKFHANTDTTKVKSLESRMLEKMKWSRLSIFNSTILREILRNFET